MAFPSRMPKAGKSRMGSREVTPMGRASVTHQRAISTAIAAVWVISGAPGLRSTKRRMAIKMTKPKKTILKLMADLLGNAAMFR